MNDTIKLLMERKSTRIFTDQKISEEEKQMIFDAACAAPSAGCQQLYTILDITSQSIKNKLVETCDHQPFIAIADMVLIFCADCKKWYEGFQEAGCNPRMPDVGDLMLAVSDANIASFSAVMAAESLGIGSCYIGDIMENYEMQRELLHLPEYVFPCAMVVFGYPKEEVSKQKKPQRSPMDTIVYENHYPASPDYARMFSAKTNGKAYEEWMKAFCQRKYNSDFSKEMSRSVREYIKQY